MISATLGADTPALTVVIPAYNEERRLPGALAAILPYLRTTAPTFEVLVVDDGSSDATASLALQGGPEVRLIRFPHNRGKGAAVRAGVEASRGTLVLISDADLSTPISEVDRLSSSLQDGADLAIGSRSVAGAQVEIRQPLHRELMGRVFNRFVQAVLLPGLLDTQCGFKLFRGDVARNVFRHCRIDGFAFDVEAIYATRRLGYQVREIPVVWRDSPNSRVSPVRDSLRMLTEVMRIRWRSRRAFATAAPTLETPIPAGSLR